VGDEPAAVGDDDDPIAGLGQGRQRRGRRLGVAAQAGHAAPVLDARQQGIARIKHAVPRQINRIDPVALGRWFAQVLDGISQADDLTGHGVGRERAALKRIESQVRAVASAFSSTLAGLTARLNSGKRPWLRPVTVLKAPSWSAKVMTSKRWPVAG